MVRTSVLLTAAFLVAGCAGAATSMSAAPLVQSAPQSGTVASEGSSPGIHPASPMTCDEGVRVLIHAGNHAFRVPRCAGWKGQIRYSSSRGVSHWTMTTSITNNFGVPAPPSGEAIFYMQMYLHNPSDWEGNNTGVTDTVTSPLLTDAHTYTLNVYNFIYNNQCPSSQCTWTMNIGSPQPGSHTLAFGSPLSGATIFSGPGFAPVWQFVQN